LNPGINIAAYVGHGSIRLAVLGMDGRKPDRGEMEAMRILTAQAMEDGAFGLSSGLIYPPGVYSDTEEMIELCRVVKAYGGVYATHMRSESNGVLDSVAETIQVARTAGLPAIISHHKIGGKHNWGKSAQTLQMIEEARSQGVDIVFDQYPYIAGNTTLSAILPPWVQVGGVEKVIANLTDPDLRVRIADEIEHDRGGWENFVSLCGWEGIVVIYAPQAAGNRR
jgi:N-acyl-D-aspartate/D-glutamate deacylase